MSIFVEDNEIVNVAVHYVDNNGKITIQEEPGPDSKTINMTFKRPDFSTSQRLIASSTVTDVGGNQTINLMLLQNNLIYFLAKSWDITLPDTKDENGNVIKGKKVEFNAENIGKLRVEIARATVNKLIEEVGQIM